MLQALLAQAVSIFGGLGAKALASGLAAKPLMSMMAKAGKVAVRVGAVCVLVPFAIRLVGARCSGEGMQRWLPRETLVVTGH